MANISKLTAVQKNKILTAYNNGKSSAFLADKFGVSVSTILYTLRAMGATIRPRGRPAQVA